MNLKDRIYNLLNLNIHSFDNFKQIKKIKQLRGIMHLWIRRIAKLNNRNLKLHKFFLKLLSLQLYYFLKKLKRINMINYCIKFNKEIIHLVLMQEYHSLY